ncbi:pantetheine-phosphate adenylyltransferase [Tateyamaria sp. ANG-S1]|uniref:pantetheine-phosphate adenylyltransferase n=1 Tax=Tateyamaria sp. ANG-S1 TaxID=1577905 RepID=UPI00068AE77C|nr:pantetheine-phosphate adenylyltransferase [Tateyamaria sp. ANG-S1]
MARLKPTKCLYAGSFDPITRGHLDVVSKALKTFDIVHIAIGTNVKKRRMFEIAESVDLIEKSLVETWPQSARKDSKGALLKGTLEIGEFENKSLIRYANQIGATHIVRGLREASDFNEEFMLHGVAARIDPSILTIHFICEPEFLHVSSSTAKELDSMGEPIDWLVTPSVQDAFARRRS